ncbi:putative 14-3-3 protein [Helianthus annuus]|uniref:14-3-3 protein n=1 Tax=Helianthus annuus TaxID=4232 RepID=A0A251TIN6_HELAN|nr:putative 14-3-3 protein [Helianthus annuus]KAJ0512579.1 putative 14-3-3 protein [Helianthus annuus]KAJ0520150.1 putative 14-3-3 protein [Helianthus annuus]KAJ0528706.1 putative 14-3-3 protein [Helianthus annuus]KAJ0695616.1 putative 14-3-3 protein [Helianthus annuus]
MDTTACEEHVYMAKLSEQAERYEEMVEFMEKVFDTEEHRGGTKPALRRVQERHRRSPCVVVDNIVD